MQSVNQCRVSAELLWDFSKVIIAMNPSYLIMMVLHLVGVLFNIRMLASCFKDKASHTILQKSLGFIVWQCILQVTFLVLNADEVTRAFGDQGPEWCQTNRILMTSVTLFIIYNLLAILAVEDHTIVCLKRELSPRVAMSGTLAAGVTSCGILFWVGAIFSPALCASFIASSFTSTLMIFLLLLLAFRICTQTDQDTMTSSTEETSLLLSFLSKNKTAVLLTAFVALVCATVAVFQLLGTVVSFVSVVTSVYTQETYIEFPHRVGSLQKIFYLNIMWFAVGIALPEIFRQLIDSSLDAKAFSDDNHFHSTKVI